MKPIPLKNIRQIGAGSAYQTTYNVNNLQITRQECTQLLAAKNPSLIHTIAPKTKPIMNDDIGIRCGIHPLDAQLIRETDNHTSTLESILLDTGANTNALDLMAFRLLDSAQAIKSITRGDHPIEISAVDGHSISTDSIIVTFDIQLGGFTTTATSTTVEIQAIVLTKSSHSLILGSNFFQQMKLSYLDPSFYTELYHANYPKPIFSSEIYNKLNQSGATSYIISHHSSLPDLILPVNDYQKHKRYGRSDINNMIRDESISFDQLDEYTKIDIDNPSSFYELCQLAASLSEMGEGARKKHRPKGHWKRLVKKKSKNRICFSRNEAYIKIPSRTEMNVPLLNPHENKPRNLNFLVSRNDEFLVEQNLPLNIMYDVGLIRPDSKSCRITNASSDIMLIPAGPQPWYIEREDTEEEPSVFTNEKIINFNLLLKKANGDIDAMKKMLRKRGIKQEDWLSLLELEMKTESTKNGKTSVSININNIKRSQSKLEMERQWREKEEAISNSMVHKEPLTQEEVDLPQPEKIKLLAPDATEEEIELHIHKLEQKMLPANGSYPEGYDERIRERFRKEVLQVIKYNTADGQIKGFACDWQTGKEEELKLSIDQTKMDSYQVRSIPCAVAHHDREACYDHLLDLLETGIIEHCDDTNFLSPLICVHQKGKRRFCIDLRANNSILKQNNAFPIPAIDDLLASLSGKRYWAQIDMVKAFHQFKLSEDSRKYTAFQAPDNTIYQYVGSCFGLHLLPSVFSQFMQKVLQDLSFNCTLNYIDDVIVFADSPDELVDAVARVCHRFVDSNLTLHPAKCKLFSDEITFVGFKVTRQGVQPDDEKVKVIKEFRKPTSQFDVQSYLGLVNFYRRFIPNFSTLSAPLQKLIEQPHLRKRDSERLDITHLWGTEQQNAFDYLCNYLASEKVTLHHPNFTKDFILTTDASTTGLGAILSQRDENGDERPVYFHSAGVPKNKRHDPPFLLELRAVMMGIDKFYQYLRHCPNFIIKTDSLALTYLSKMSRPSAQFKRWQVELSNFNYVIQHVKGSYNVVADCLSRNPKYNEIRDPNDDAISKVCDKILELRKERHEHITTLEKLKERNNKDLDYLKKIDKSQMKQLEKEIHEKSRSIEEEKLRLEILHDKFVNLTELVDARDEFENNPDSIKTNSTDDLTTIQHHINVMQTRRLSQEQTAVNPETSEPNEWYPVGQEIVFKNDHQHYLQGKITRRLVNPLFSSNPGYLEHWNLKDYSNIMIPTGTKLFFYWKESTGSVIYQPLNIRTLWYGITQTHSNGGGSEKLTMETESGYGWNESITEIRKEWISPAPIFYEVEVIAGGSTHRIWIEDNRIDTEITQNMIQEEEDNIENEGKTQEGIEELDRIGSLQLQSEDNTSRLIDLLSLKVFNETDLTMTAEEENAARTTDLAYIYQRQREAEELSEIIAELGEPPKEKLDLWKEHLISRYKKSKATDPLNPDRMTEIRTKQIRKILRYQHKIIHKPEGQYFWDIVYGQPILKMLRYEGRASRNIDLGILKEKLNAPVLLIPREWGIKLAFHEHSMRGHCGRQKLYSVLRKTYEWPNMFLDISLIVQTCYECQKTQYNLMPQGQFQAITPHRINEVVAIDLMVLPLSYDGYKYIMNVVDYLSRHVVSIPLKRKDRKSVKDAFLKQYLCRFGRPRKLVVDQGSEFNNQLFRDLNTFAKIDVRYTGTEHHETNGVVERFNQTLKHALQSYAIDADERKWTDWLYPYVYRYNLTSHDILGGESPHYVRFGYSDDDPLTVLTNEDNRKAYSAKEHLESSIPDLYNYWHKISEYMEQQRKKDNDRKRQHCNEVKFSLGERAWLYWPNRVTRAVGDEQAALKLHDMKRYLVVITDELESGRFYRCNTDSNRVIERTVHVRFLKKYVPNSNPPGIYSRIEDDLSSNKPSLELVSHEDTIGKYPETSTIIHEIDHRSQESGSPSTNQTFSEQIINDSTNDNIGRYFKFKNHIYCTFYINYHPKLKSHAIWSHVVSENQTRQHTNTIIMSLPYFTKKFKKDSTKRLDNISRRTSSRSTTKRRKNSKGRS